MTPECGNYNDNLEVLRAAEDARDRGLVEEWVARIGLLRDHILRTREEKSVRHLLPMLDELSADERGACLVS